jgi:hypothetical protein
MLAHHSESNELFVILSYLGAKALLTYLSPQRLHAIFPVPLCSIPYFVLLRTNLGPLNASYLNDFDTNSFS